MSRSQEQAASRYFGKHVTPAKALTLCLVSVLACLLPMLLGLRLWDRIPSLVTTGLVSTEGIDDSMPRSVLVFGVPGLFALLDLVCHTQLWLHQKAERIPPMPVRLLGRWTLAVLANILCPFWLLRAAAQTAAVSGLLPALLALLLLLTGGHFFDCPRSNRLSFRLPCIAYRENAWRRTHRLGSVCWMLAGLMLLTLQYTHGSISPLSLLPLLLLLFAPLAAAPLFAKKEPS